MRSQLRAVVYGRGKQKHSGFSRNSSKIFGDDPRQTKMAENRWILPEIARVCQSWPEWGRKLAENRRSEDIWPEMFENGRKRRRLLEMVRVYADKKKNKKKKRERDKNRCYFADIWLFSVFAIPSHSGSNPTSLKTLNSNKWFLIIFYCLLSCVRL